MLARTLGVVLLGGLTAAPAAGQGLTPYPPLRWVAQESLDSHADARDEAEDMVYWEEIIFAQPNRHWVYVTGWVTEMDGGEVVGTRFATYKYDGEFFDEETGDPPEPEERAFFPPLTTALLPGQEYKAVAMAVNGGVENAGDIYVVGQAPWYDDGTTGGATSDLNYCVISYDKFLVQKDIFFYDGPVSGDDIPVDIVWAGGKVIVTGTSPGNGTGKDIATIALKDEDLTVEGDLWPNSAWGGPGIRRYNNELEDGDDVAVEIGPVVIVGEGSEQAPHLNVVILGTSWGGASKNDYTTHGWGYIDGVFLWDARYDNDAGANDVATGITGFGGDVWVTGWSEVPSSSFGPTGWELNADYLTISYKFEFCPYDPMNPDPYCEPEVLWTERWDVNGGRDFPADIQRFVPFSGPQRIWVTGTGLVSDYDAATVVYEHDPSPTGPLVSWTDTWGISTHAEAGRALALCGDEAYITGRLKASTSDHMLGLKYQPTSSTPPYEEDWYKLFRSASYGSGVEHEGRAIVATPVGVFIAGVSTLSGEGQQFTTWRYEEE